MNPRWILKTLAVCVVAACAAISAQSPSKQPPGMPAAVKDVKRFGDKKWGYFSLMSDGKPTPSKTMLPDQCWSCHKKNGAVDNTCVQFYPTLKPIAEEKGTYKESGAGVGQANSRMKQARARRDTAMRDGDWKPCAC